jgi:hypothetical protein
MSTGAPLVCLITPGHIGSTPRLVKEADALVEAGYRVHVVAGRHYPAADPLDADILATARWACTRVDFRGGAGTLARKLLRRLARRRVARDSRAGLWTAARASHAEALHLGRVAGRFPARLYIGHCLAALPAAARAAAQSGGAYGFDLEDFHDAETAAALSDPAERHAIAILEKGLLPGCAHLTASAPLIAGQYAEIYRVEPRTVLNVFPRSQAPAAPLDPGPISGDRPAVVYWFSQTIGAGRGLEAAVAILARMRTPVELHLRGTPADGYAGRLQATAARAGLSRPIRFLPPGSPAEMARLAAGAHLGLSAEERVPLNRDLCLTNKVFIYLLAGIPQLLSHTSAQGALAGELGDAALLADLGQTEATARRLDEFFAQPGAAAGARRRAWELATRRYCWDVEKSLFLDSVRAAVPLP